MPPELIPGPLLELWADRVATPLAWGAALVAARIAALVATAPLFGLRGVPWTVRGALGLALTLLAAPLHAPAAAAFPGGVEAAPLLIREVLIGASCGWSLLVLVASLHLAGELVWQVSGLGRGAMLAPELATPESPCGRLLELTAVALLLGSGGHHLVLDALLDTFHILPIGIAGATAPPLQELTSLGSCGFEFGLRAAAPAAMAAIGAMLLLAAAGRVLPQLRAVASGTSVSALAGVGMLLLALGGSVRVATHQLPELLAHTREMWLPESPPPALGAEGAAAPRPEAPSGETRSPVPRASVPRAAVRSAAVRSAAVRSPAVPGAAEHE